jgi:RimJ/RimL family protein N-acetyltransferase
MSTARFKRYRLGRPWCEAIELANGRRLILRPMQATDAPLLRRSFARLTPEEVRLRFMHPIKELSPTFANRLASIDRDQEFALVLVEALHPDEALIGAVIRAAIDPGGEQAEFAIIVGHEIAQSGLGTYLLGKAVEWARKKRLKSIYGLVLPDNTAMLALARKLGFKSRPYEGEEDLIEVRKRLQPDS